MGDIIYHSGTLITSIILFISAINLEIWWIVIATVLIFAKAFYDLYRDYHIYLNNKK
ncbi:hypothetical protein GCM10028778_16830 [Barrientosiimonas marina]|uniref:hypothetical protein n=1 Tax=Lentibacillus kimchii TaxID=1542911 RepID=UPI0036D43AA0